MKLSDNKKRIIAREFLYLSAGIAIVLCAVVISLIYESWLENNVQEKKEKVIRLRKDLSNIQSRRGSRDLWDYLKINELYSKSYSEFLRQFETDEKQKKLFKRLTFRDYNEIDKLAPLGTPADLYNRLFKIVSNVPKYPEFKDILVNEEENRRTLYKELKSNRVTFGLKTYENFNNLFFDSLNSLSSPDETELRFYILRNSESLDQQIDNVYLGSFNDFIRSYFPKADSSLSVKEQKLEREIHSLKKEIRYNETDFNHGEIAITFATLYFIILFVIRYFIYGITWSIRVLRN